MDWIESFLQNYGIWAMFVLIMLEYACFPVSSGIILPMAGVMAAGQGLFFPYLVLFATGAGLIGTLIPYGIGRFGGSPLLERIMKRFSSMEKPILTSYRVFGNHEKSAVLISRVIPLCRTYIGFVAGAMGQNISRYLLYSAIGIVTWNTVLTGLGYYFYQYKDLFFHYLDKYKHVIFYTGIILLVIFALNAIRKKRAARGTNQEE